MFETLKEPLLKLKNSDIPEERLIYFNGIKELIILGERLYQSRPDENLEESIKELKEVVENYKLYPLVNSL